MGTRNEFLLEGSEARCLVGWSESADKAGEAVDVVPERSEGFVDAGPDSMVEGRSSGLAFRAGERRLVTIEAMFDLAFEAAARRERPTIGWCGSPPVEWTKDVDDTIEAEAGASKSSPCPSVTGSQLVLPDAIR
jgi:hypothetical protein